ncbi:MAG: nicotinate-nucleotide--dimethylbenzimidazole phosphoribosyltransferase [Synechococcus sp.]
MPSVLSLGCELIGGSSSAFDLAERLAPWRDRTVLPDVLVVLAGTRTAEIEGISAAGSTAEARRYTAIADAELLLHGPSHLPCWPLPPLPAGVSPALISWVAVQALGLTPQVAALGLPQSPPFTHLRMESPHLGPSACLRTGRAMAVSRVQHLWNQGYRLGSALRRPLVLAECVPGGTTTAQAVLQGLGVPVHDLVSGSALHPPLLLKRRLVDEGLAAAALPALANPLAVVAAVGDPFQAFAAGVVLGAVKAQQPVMLAGGSQMLAVIALVLSRCAAGEHSAIARWLMVGTTAWLAAERLEASTKALNRPAFPQVLDRLEAQFQVPLLALACGLHFQNSRHPQLRAYEQGYVKEGVGAGGLALLAQLRGVPLLQLQRACDRAMDALGARQQWGGDQNVSPPAF